MAHDEHVALLKKGVAGWNAWRDEDPDIRPDLNRKDLTGRTSTGRPSSGRTCVRRTCCYILILLNGKQPEPKLHQLVAYYRVSTRKQGRSGLGLEAQRTVADFAKG